MFSTEGFEMIESVVCPLFHVSDVFVQVMLFWNVTQRNVASLLILIFWL